MTESRLRSPSTREDGTSSRRSSVPQPAKVSHDGGHADRSGARVSRCSPTGLSHAAGSVALLSPSGRCGGEGPVVAQEGPQHTGAASCEGDDGLDVFAALAAFLEVVVPLGPSRMMLDCAER